MTGYADPRRDAVRRVDTTKVRSQIERINDIERSRSYQRDLFSQIQAMRRSPRGGEGDAAAPPASYDVGSLEQPEGFLVAVTGEILVRSEAEATALLVQEGFSAQDVPAKLRGRVSRFVKPGAPVAATNQLARRLRHEGIGASVNYVVPLGYVAKGEGGFEPTEVEDSYRGPEAAANGAIRVAVIDTGIAGETRRDNWLNIVARGADNEDSLYMADGKTLNFSAGHGQFTAGVIQQVAPRAAISMYRGVKSDGIGSETEIASAILQAGDDGAQIINLSLGTETADDAPPVGLQVALEILAEEHPDVLVVAAAGNSGSTRPSWPAAFRSVVAVASLTPDLRPSMWSNRGSWVDCSTIGEGIVSTYVEGEESREVDKIEPDIFPKDSWAVGTGTSFAAPQVTGRVADLLADDPKLTPRGALNKILSGGRPVPSYGRATKILPGTTDS